MASWVLVPSLKTLFAEFDAIAPNRDHASDGAVGDLAHQQEVSDHNPDETGRVPTHDADSINEVHAIDVDNNLNADFTMEDVIQYILSECRKTVGNDRGRLKYIIYNRRIWEASNGWQQRAYTGASPHTEHAHFSNEYDTKYESDTRTWGLIERFGDDFPMDQATYNKMQIESFKNADVRKAFNSMMANAISNIEITDYADPNSPQRILKWVQWIGYSDGRADVGRVEKDVIALQAEVDAIKEITTETQQTINSHVAGLIENK